MRVLAINCGSSTLKFRLFEMSDTDEPRNRPAPLAWGSVAWSRGRASIDFRSERAETLCEFAELSDHGEATRRLFGWLESSGLPGSNGLDAIGFRVVHGGDRFALPSRIDADVLNAVRELAEQAPLHNQPALDAIMAARSVLGPRAPMVAVFDTAFHHSMPEHARRYAIPIDLADKHGIRRYGFHGIAHRYMAERYAALKSTPLDTAKLVTFQLGNGCSAAAVRGGVSVDTSMGLTPLEGLVMGTRSGDVDPSLAGFLARRENVTVEEVENWLNRQSGLLGVSGRSRDMRELLELERTGDARAALAMEMFCYRARKYLGAYLAVLEGAEAVLFGGGIGENSSAVRARICHGMDWCGLVLDEAKNGAAVGIEQRISADDARVHAYVIRVDEEMLVAEDTMRCLSTRS